MKLLVTGGAGYIGSVTVDYFLKKGVELVVFDNLVYGHPENLDSNIELIEGDLTKLGDIESVFEKHQFDGVVHFASYIEAGESYENPSKYFRNNLIGALNLLDTMVKHGCKKFVFSSTCAVFGTPDELPVKEDSLKHPESPYGESKYNIERFLYWYDKAYGLKSMILRYFNACGATLDGKMGEDHNPETHLIPNVFTAALSDSPVKVFGDDYETDDGTGVRDYIHVLDLASAHYLAFKKLEETEESDDFNLSSGQGYSVMEVIKAIEEKLGKSIKTDIQPRRLGDPARVWGDPSKAKSKLGWQTEHSGLETIIETSAKWHSKKL